MQVCREWAVEVDQDQHRKNLEAQEEFVVSFLGRLYRDIDSNHETLSKIASLHFTRIWDPPRDKMGAYVRLRIFAEDTDLDSIEREIDERLNALRDSDTIFRVKKQFLDWGEIAKKHGGPELAPVFRDYLDSISRISYQLLCKKRDGISIDEQLWPWTHFFFNATRGYGRSVVEVAKGAIIAVHQNI